MVRIGVNIPKELHQRLQPLKGTMNISEICREAIEARVKKYEEFVGWLDSESAKQVVAEICEKELQRKALVGVDWETIGYQDAKDWVQAATLADWNYWNRYRNDSDRQHTIWVYGRYVHDTAMRGRFISPGSARTFHERHREYTELINEQDDEFWEWIDEEYGGISGVYDLVSAERDYGRGWMAHTTAVWEMICQKREEYQQNWHRNREESRRNRPRPEVPEHFFSDAQSQEEPPFQGVPHHAGYAPGVDPLKLNHLIGDLDVEDFLAKREMLQ